MNSLRWVRPLHGIVAMLGEKIVPLEIDGIASGATTVGHRFHHPGPITVGGASDYLQKLRACHVIVDQDERERIVRDGAVYAARIARLALLVVEGLVVENTGLTEWPVPLLGRFDADFLDVPREVIVLTMRTNQKYFACTNDQGLLAPAFICVANVAASDGGEAIVGGNRRVLAARLSDARFFWEQDLKIPIERYLPKLDQMLFYEGMGSLRTKADRLATLAKSICDRWFPQRDPDTAHRAGLLAKADLATAMVGEFPELQGVMGGYYAERGGEKPGVASALKQQYQQTVEGCIPACVALADRLDTLAYFFAKRLKPTGSKDPFALRRSALGVISTIVANNLHIPLREALKDALPRPDTDDLDAFEKLYWQTKDPEAVIEEILQDLLDFFADRLKVQQRDAGVRHDLIDAVFALGGEDDLVRLLARVKALQEFVETADGNNLLVAYKRVANILKKEKWEGSSASGGADLAQEEKALIAALDKAEPKASAAIAEEDFTAAMSALSSLRKPIDEFFDHVTVNDPDSAKRERRLNLLMRFRDAVNRVADFSRIEG
jgi:glycyl-tRNA synthetase beta chain